MHSVQVNIVIRNPYTLEPPDKHSKVLVGLI